MVGQLIKRDIPTYNKRKEMSYFLKHLRHAKISADIRWIVKYDAKGKVKEVKQLFNPKEYSKFHNRHNRPILDKEKLIKILENDKK